MTTSINPADAPAEAPQRWWEQRAVAVALALTLAVPLLLPQVPPLIDVPGHIGRYAIALGYDNSPILQRFYAFRWVLIGNLGVDLLVHPLGYLIGVEPAAKLVITAIPVLLGAGLLLCARVAHGRLPPTTPFALAFVYSFPFHYGFVNFYLAAALALLAFALWLRLTAAGRPRVRFALFAPIAAIVWLAHAIGWAMLVVVCAVSAFQAYLRRDDGIVRSSVGTGIACLALMLPLLPATVQAGGATGWTSGWLDIRELAKWAVMVNRDRWLPLDLAYTIGAGLFLAAAALRRLGLRIEPILGWPALALAFLCIVTPQWVGGAAYVGSRILAITVLLALVAVNAPASTAQVQARLAWVAAGLFALRLAATTLSLARAGAENAANLQALAHLPRGSLVATFAPIACRPTPATWYMHRASHLGGIAVARREAFANNLWEIDGVQPLRIRVLRAGAYRHDPSENVTLERCPGRGLPDLDIAVAGLPRHAFTHVWLIQVPPASRPHYPWLKPLFVNDNTALYRLLPQ